MAARLRVSEADIHSMRRGAMLEIAAAVGLEPGELDLLWEELQRLDEADWERRTPGPSSRARGVKGKWRPLARRAVLLAALAAAVGIAAWSRRGEPPQVAAVAAASIRVDGPVTDFQRLNHTHGAGTVRLLSVGPRPRIQLRVWDFLRPQGGGYTVWLYNSPADAHRLAFTTWSSFHGELRLPRNYARYRFVDISRELTDDSAHSGLSLLRAPLGSL